ncbi:unnamed protein product [Angiostrongylus costaricensis]|uniref:G_PROTEIN_RECEP_F1_2 domain-containing protein n=1 Tax=Angiostrongylus costaricensis TaxID=334426 RepID=A0A0R3Q2B7_ANGCS|nr:unnamed protein product [Angiostrongylus costaricensis]
MHSSFTLPFAQNRAHAGCRLAWEDRGTNLIHPYATGNHAQATTIICFITSPITGLVYDVMINSIVVFNILIIICYILFICFLNKIGTSSTNMKHIYRSLIVVSLTTVFGWFSTIIIAFVANLLQIEIELLYVQLLAGLFVNFACAANFFVYYVMSTIIIVFVANLLQIEIELLYVQLLAGLFVNFACAANFFVYYVMRLIGSKTQELILIKERAITDGVI